jgi:hypothetical protein
MAPRPLSLLCLHGYSMTSGMLKQHMEPHVRRLKGLARLTFAQAPHEVPWDDDGGGPASKSDLGLQFEEKRKVYAWAKVHVGNGAVTNVEGMPASLRLLASAEAHEMAAHGHGFDGLLGFSQGAIIASLLLALSTEPGAPITPRFAIFAGGAPFSKISPDPGVATLFERATPVQLPTLHIIGEHDTTVLPAWSASLEELCAEAKRVTHSHHGGHVVPSDELSLRTFEEFLLARQAEM